MTGPLTSEIPARVAARGRGQISLSRLMADDLENSKSAPTTQANVLARLISIGGQLAMAAILLLEGRQ